MSHLLRKAALSAIGGSLLVATLGLAPAAAEKPDTPHGQARHERSDHDGDADSSSSTSYTEDNDTNDGGTANNVADDGDNRHPSGRDRSVEHGGSGNQGRSESDPDDNGRGPERTSGRSDKPNGDGGIDRADQDGNNGCGNDDDFEDDNEGWCGRKPERTKPEHEAKPEAKPEVKPEHEAKPCPNGSMERPCGAQPEAKPEHKPETKPEHKPAKPHKPCKNGSMTRPCHAKPSTDVDDDDDATATPDAKPETDVEGAEHHVGSSAGVSCPVADMDDDAPSSICHLAAANDADDDDADDDEAETEVLGMESSRGGAAVAEVPASTVSARSAGGGVLASLPVVGSVIQGQLPFTGISTLSFLIVAMAAMVIGFLLVRASRRTKVGATS